MKKIILNYLVIAAIVVVAALFTSCGGSGGSSGSGSGESSRSGSSGNISKKLSGTYVGKSYGNEVTITFSENKIKLMNNGVVWKEGIYELIEEYQEDDFSRGTVIITDRDGKDEANYTLKGKKGEIFTMKNIILVKEGRKSSKIPSGTYSNNEGALSFSGNNIKEVDRNTYEREYTYEFIVGYENKGISKGYLILRDENGESISSCVLENDKLTIDNGQGNLLVFTKE